MFVLYIFDIGVGSGCCELFGFLFVLKLIERADVLDLKERMFE